MGRQAYPIIGGIIGAVAAAFFSEGTATLQGYEAGFAIGAAIGGIAGSYIDPILLQGNKIGDTNLQVAAEGGARAMVYGRACITATCVVARGNRKVVKKKSSNGKGSSGSTQNETVTWTFAIGLGEALIGGSITRIWQDDNLVWDALHDGQVSEEDNAKFGAGMRFYQGTETQLPDPDLQVFLGADTPYFRGTAYVVFPNFDLTSTAERIPQFKFEVIAGVTGIIEQLETLEWRYEGSDGFPPTSQSVTLTASPDILLNCDMYFTGEMETRDYIDPTVVGGSGRFCTAPNTDGGGPFNIYKVVIDKPPQTYYVNRRLIGEGSLTVLSMDGSPDFKLTVQIAGDATVTFAADPVDGHANFTPQFGSARVEITGYDETGNDTITLSSIANDLLTKAGLDYQDFDTSILTDQVEGVCIQTTVIGADAVVAVISPFFADPTEKDGKLMWVKRGGDIVRTLTFDDLVEEPDVATRENVIEYPANLSFYYQSPLTGYAMTKATSRRYSPQADNSGEGSVTAPVTFSNSSKPAQIAQILHKVAWAEAEGSFQWKVGLQCIDLLPGDCVGLFLRGVRKRARITGIENDGTSLTLTMMNDRKSAYTSIVEGITLPPATPPLPTTMSKAVLGVLDVSALLDTDDQLCYYTAISGSTATWQGAELQRSLDGGATWNPIGQVTTDATMGLLTVAVTAATPEYTDTTNVVTVQLFDPVNELHSLSDTTFLQEQGAIAVQCADGTWEIMQYRDALDGGDGLYTLSYLQRGRLSTGGHSHAIGALFVLLDTEVVKNAAQSAWLGVEMKHRAVSFSTSAEDADIVTITYEGRSQVEWSPAKGVADFDDVWLYVHDIVPRHRFGTEVSPLASVNFTGYRVTYTDGTTTLTADILAGNSAYIQISPLTTITGVTVAAINKITGAGDSLVLVPNSMPDGALAPEAIINGGGD